MPRKTISVNDMVDSANTFLANSAKELTEQRYGVIIMVERILMDADNYGGYRSLQAEEVPADGSWPGVKSKPGRPRHRDLHGTGEMVDMWFYKTDDSRRQYGLKKY